MRVLGIFALASLATAQEAPLIHSTGTSLSGFEVHVRLEGVKHDTAQNMAGSFAKLLEDAHIVRQRFARLFRSQHLDTLRRYYDLKLVKLQEAWYAGKGVRDYQCEVVSTTVDGDTATARLRRHWLDPKGKRVEAFSELDIFRRNGSWWLKSVQDLEPGKAPVTRGLGVPPPEQPIKIPALVEPDFKSPETTVASLNRDMRRLGLIRNQGSRSLQRRYFAILRAFYGPEVAAKALENRPEPKKQPEIVVEILKPQPRMGDMIRLAALVRERVPDSDDLLSSIGIAAFDMRPVNDKWRIVQEFTRPKPEMAFQAIRSDFGLIFIVGDTPG